MLDSPLDPGSVRVNPYPGMAIRKCVAVWLGVIYDFQATNRKDGGLSVRHPPSSAFLLVAWESDKPHIRPEYTKTHRHKQVNALAFD